MSKRKRRSPSAPRKTLRIWRKAGGRTLQDLAVPLEVSASQLCEFERGVCSLPPEKVRKLQQILRQSLRARARKIGRLLAADGAIQKLPRHETPYDLSPHSQSSVSPAANAEDGQENP